MGQPFAREVVGSDDTPIMLSGLQEQVVESVRSQRVPPGRAQQVGVSTMEGIHFTIGIPPTRLCKLDARARFGAVEIPPDHSRSLTGKFIHPMVQMLHLATILTSQKAQVRRDHPDRTAREFELSAQSHSSHPWGTRGSKRQCAMLTHWQVGNDSRAFFEADSLLGTIRPNVPMRHLQSIRQPLACGQTRSPQRFLQEYNLRPLLFHQFRQAFQAIGEIPMTRPIMPEVCAYHRQVLILNLGFYRSGWGNLDRHSGVS